jgi:hypothetical protein
MRKIIILFAVVFTSCTTIKNEPNKTALNLLEQQTEIAVTGIKIEEKSLNIFEDLTALEYIEEVKPIAIKAENLYNDIIHLNALLEAERDTANDLIIKMEELTIDNQKLNIFNEKLKGQRNVLLVITAALVIIIAGYIVFKLAL